MFANATAARPPESALQHLVRSVLVVNRDATCGEVLTLLREQRFDYTDAIVVADETGCLLGIASTGRIAASRTDAPVAGCAHRAEAASVDMDQERVASLAIRNALGTVPVVDARGHVIGLIPPQATLTVLRHEHVEDLDRFTGILRENAMAHAAINGPPARRAQHRLPWLLVGLAGSALAAIVMSRFEALMQSHMVAVYFLPGVVYLADAIGTQTEAIAVRGLSLSHRKIGSLIARELWTGLLIGAMLGAAGGIALWAVLHNRGLALAVGVALFAAGGFATVVGLLLPWLFQRLGLDPAYGSGPLATVVQDILSLLVYFTAVLIFVA